MGDIREKKTLKIAGISIWRILTYFIIYSMAGFIIETLFGFLTKGMLESRKGFLYGPFCPIYGVGAIIMILSLQYFKKNNYTLFFGGFLIGSIVEYLISYFGELIFKVNWWDYSDRFLNINGRICLTFSLFWGLLAIYLIKHFNPLIDKIIDKTKEKIIVEIKDYGIGMDEEECKKIFDRFYQVDKSHKEKGTGLGLAIVKRIIDLSNGSIEVESRTNKGAKFIVTLPAKL